MNIRLQTLLFIVPIFLGVAFAGAWLRLTAQEQELLWGLTESTTSKAVGLAAWLDGERMSTLEEADPESVRRLQRSLSGALGLASRLYVLTPDGKKVLLDAARAESNAAPAIDSHAMSEALSGKPFTSGIMTLPDGNDIVLAVSAIKDKNGSVTGLAAAEMPANELREEREALLSTALRISLAVAVFGTLVALCLARIIRVRIRELTRAAKKLAAGDYQQRLEPGVIREVTELNNTFNTLASVLGDVVDKTERALVDAEQLRSDETLRTLYAEECFPASLTDLSGKQILALLANRSCEGDFFSVVESPEGMYTVVGRVGADSPLERVKHASAARAACQSLLSVVGPKKTFDQLSELLEVKQWSSAFVPCNEGKVRVQVLRDGTLLESERHLELSPVVLHTLEPEAEQKVKLHLRCLPETATEEFLQDFRAILAPERSGALAVIRAS